MPFYWIYVKYGRMISSLSDSVCLHLYILCFGRLVHAWIICQTNIFSKACKKCPKKQIWMYRTFVLNSSRTSVRLGAWFWSAKLTYSYQNHCASSRSVYLSRRPNSHWDKFAITHHLKRGSLLDWDKYLLLSLTSDNPIKGQCNCYRTHHFQNRQWYI